MPARTKQKNNLNVDFLSLASHSLRTPLSITKWQLELLMKERVGPLNAEQRDFVQNAYSANERMIKIITDLLLVSRIQRKSLHLDKHVTKISDVVNRIIQENRTKLSVSTDEVRSRIPEDLPPVIVDPEKIQIALGNIIQNAIMYSREKREVVVDGSYRAGDVTISVRDQGVGIAKEEQRKVYRRFFRSTEVLKFATEGMGLGLFISKSIIEAHGGKIWFTSRAGKGTTFYFSLPTAASISRKK